MFSTPAPLAISDTGVYSIECRSSRIARIAGLLDPPGVLAAQHHGLGAGLAAGWFGFLFLFSCVSMVVLVPDLYGGESTRALSVAPSAWTLSGWRTRARNVLRARSTLDAETVIGEIVLMAVTMVITLSFLANAMTSGLGVARPALIAFGVVFGVVLLGVLLLAMHVIMLAGAEIVVAEPPSRFAQKGPDAVLVASRNSGLRFGCVVGLVFALSVGLVFALAVGVVFALPIGLTTWLLVAHTSRWRAGSAPGYITARCDRALASEGCSRDACHSF